MVKVNCVQVMCLTESWLTADCPVESLNITGFTVYRRDRSDGRRGGGVLAYVANTLQCRRLANLESVDVEALWLLCRYCRMPRQVSHIIFGVIYFPPNGDGARVVGYILDCLDKITQKHPHVGILLCGDFNQLNDRPIVNYPLKQLVTAATRRRNILDKIYTNIPSWFHTPIVLPPIGTSDHNTLLLCTVDSRSVMSNESRVDYSYVRSNDNSRKTFLAHALKNHNWSLMYSMDDCNSMVTYFYNVIHSMLDTFLPFRIIAKMPSDKPWINERLKELITQRQLAWHKQDTKRYHVLRNSVQREVRNLRRRYYKRCVSSLRNAGPRKWWQAVKRFTGESQHNPLARLTAISSESNTQNLIDNVNNAFHAVSADLLALDLSLIPVLGDCSYDDYIIEPFQVQRKLDNLNLYKAPGPDDLPNWFLRDFSVWLAEPLCAIYNRSIRYGFMPTVWKQANIVPVPKANHVSDITNDLRPISLTPAVSKILESFVGQWILDDLHGKLDKYQYGALRGKSTTHELVDILHHWHEAIDNHSSVRVVFIDYAKAFDHVDHSTVVRKLTVLGVAPILVRWVCSFLCDRQQRVKLSQYVADWITLTGGMPQGSYLGPLIFLVLINDLTAGCLLHKFMDDTTLSEVIPKGGSSSMLSILTDVVNWSKDNLMNINWNKTKEMRIGSNMANILDDVLCYNDTQIKQVCSFKLLGIVIDHNLKWSSHVDEICTKASRRLHFLKVLKRSAVSVDDLYYFYVSAIRPVLEYACPVWHTSLTKEQTKQLESVQKRAFRIIYNSNCLDYENFCVIHQLQTLSIRRDILCKSFFDKQVLNTNSCLHYLLPQSRISVNNRLRKVVPFPPPRSRTVRFSNSFIPFALSNYQ